MAFPTTGILDNFNRADSTTTIGSNWSLLDNFSGSLANQGISSNQLYNPVGSFSNYTAMYWNPTIFGPDCEAYMTIATRNSASGSDNPAVYVRCINPGTTFSGYDASYDDLGNVKIDRIDAGTGTVIKSIAQVVVSGDIIGLQIISTMLTLYLNHGGVWSAITSVSDTTYTNAGNIGFYLPGNTQDGRFDDFGGGAISSLQAITIGNAQQPIIRQNVIVY